MRYAAKWPEYAHQWDRMKINDNRKPEFKSVAKFAVDHKGIYQSIEAKTGVFWPLIAVLHRRESDADFNTYLGNGQSLHRATTIVPRHRGPFPNFEAGAIDALRIDGLSSVSDWRLEKMLYYCEAFNGWGYSPHPSPYVWGGTNIQVPGKYVSDGVFNSHVWDPQPGCAPILATIAELDPTVHFAREQ